MSRPATIFVYADWKGLGIRTAMEPKQVRVISTLWT
jgi:hypothetical protein